MHVILLLFVSEANAAFVEGDTVLNIVKKMGFDPQHILESDIPSLAQRLESFLKGTEFIISVKTCTAHENYIIVHLGLKITQIQRATHRTVKFFHVTKKPASKEL